MKILPLVCVTNTQTPTKSVTPTPTQTTTKTQTPTSTKTPAVSPTSTETRLPTPTPTPTTTYTRTPTQTRTQTPTQTKTSTILPIKLFEGPYNESSTDSGLQADWSYCADRTDLGEAEFVGSSFDEELTIQNKDGKEIKVVNYEQPNDVIEIDGSAIGSGDPDCGQDADGAIPGFVISLNFDVPNGSFVGQANIPFTVERLPDPSVTYPATPIKPSRTPTQTSSMTPTQTPSLSLSMTASKTPTSSPTVSISMSPSSTVTMSPTESKPTPTPTSSEYWNCGIYYPHDTDPDDNIDKPLLGIPTTPPPPSASELCIEPPENIFGRLERKTRYVIDELAWLYRISDPAEKRSLAKSVILQCSSIPELTLTPTPTKTKTPTPTRTKTPTPTRTETPIPTPTRTKTPTPTPSKTQQDQG